MKYFLPIFFFVIGILLFGIVLFLQNNPFERFAARGPAVQFDPLLKGFQLSPKSFSATDFPDFFESNQELNGTTVGWTGSVKELAKKDGTPRVIAALSRTYDYEPVYAIQSYSRESGELLPEFISSKQSVVNFIKETDARYFGIGVEVNDLYQKSPAEYAKFVKLFAEFAQTIHAQSPRTHVFTIFQYEKLLGLKGGLFGGANDTKEPMVMLLKDFPDADIIGMTTYPTLIYQDPQQIPANYYARLFTETTKPVLFTEMGWIRGTSVKGWEGSPQEQAVYLEKFADQIHNQRVEGYLWSFLYDQQAAQKPFNEMGFREASDSKMQTAGEEYWKKDL